MLDKFESLYEAIAALENIGTAKLFGNQLSCGKLPSSRYSEVLSAGVEILKAWPASFENLIRGMRPPPEDRGHSAPRFYGPIYYWAKQLPDNDFGSKIRSIIAKIHGKDGSFRMKGFLSDYNCSTGVPLNVAAKEVGVSNRTFRYFAESLDMVPRKGEGRLLKLIPLSMLDQIKTGLANSVTLEEAAIKLGVIRATVRSSGILTPVQFTKHPRLRPRYDNREVDAFLTKMRRGLATLDRMPENCLALTSVNRGHCGSLGSVCKMILEGKIVPRGMLKGARGLAAVVIDAKELRTLARTKAGAPYTVDEAAERMGLASETIRPFIRKKLLASILVGRRRLAISDEAIDCFRAQFITSKELNNTLGTTPRQLANAVRRAGIIPALGFQSKDQYRTSVYRRTEFPTNLVAWWRKQRMQ